MKSTRMRVMGMGVAALVVAMLAGPVAAQTNEELMQAMQRMQQRMEQQDARIAELEGMVGDDATDAQSQAVLDAVLADLEDRGYAGPAWAENLDFYGDFRLRFEYFCNSAEKPNDEDDEDRGRVRYRLRFAFKKTWLEDQIEVGFRLASGGEDGDYEGTSDPTSTNQTLDQHFSAKSIWIDRAYARYRPASIPGLMIIAGKFGNPLVSTAMVWDSDINPEGIYGQYTVEVCEGLEVFGGAGYLMFEEMFDDERPFPGDETVAVYTGGFSWDVVEDVTWNGAVSYYDWDGVEDNAFLVGGGNTVVGGELAAGDFGVINLVSSVKFTAFDLPFTVFGDYAHNCENEIEGTNDAWSIGGSVGSAKRAGDWAFSYAYRYIDNDAVIGALTDSDFGGSGRHGHVIGGRYMITDFLQLGVTVLFVEPINNPSDEQRTTIQGDLVWKF